jgi:uncharacterized protein (DUF1330 family)
MPYLVATVTISDTDKFKAYLTAIDGLSERFGGSYVCRGPVAEMVEGEAPKGERVVIVEFPTEEALRGYIESPEYLHGKALREGGAKVQMRLIK